MSELDDINAWLVGLSTDESDRLRELRDVMLPAVIAGHPVPPLTSDEVKVEMYRYAEAEALLDIFRNRGRSDIRARRRS
jgi:hypothetical protein